MVSVFPVEKARESQKHLENRTNEKMRVGKSFFQVHYCFFRNPLSPNFTKWSNTLKQFVGKLWANCLSVFDHFVGLALKGSRVLEYKPLSLSSIKKGFYYAKMFESQSASEKHNSYPVSNHTFKDSNRDTRARCDICSKFWCLYF